MIRRTWYVQKSWTGYYLLTDLPRSSSFPSIIRPSLTPTRHLSRTAILPRSTGILNSQAPRVPVLSGSCILRVVLEPLVPPRHRSKGFKATTVVNVDIAHKKPTRWARRTSSMSLTRRTALPSPISWKSSRKSNSDFEVCSLHLFFCYCFLIPTQVCHIEPRFFNHEKAVLSSFSRDSWLVWDHGNDRLYRFDVDYL